MELENYKILSNGHRITCGIILMNKDKAILAGHPTGKGFHKECYDILKGCCDAGEEDIDCAIRELREESGIDLSDKKDKIIDLGIKHYNKTKDIHLFLYKVDKFPRLRSLTCNSYFPLNGDMLPEMSGYKVISKKDRYLFYRGLQIVFKDIKEIN